MRAILLALLLVASLRSHARAQSEDAASQAFAEGERAFADADYPLALERFETAFRLAPHDAVRFNVAVCLERLGRFRDAWLQYRAAAESATLGQAERDDATRGAERLYERLGVLHVAAPAGAEIRVDDDPRCTAPCDMEVDPGAHELAAVLGGTVVRSERVEVERGARVELSLEPGPRARGPGWLAIVGGGVTAVGIAGLIGFGVQAQSAYDRYTSMPVPASRATYDEGVLAQALANTSIVVAVVGAAVLVLDLVLGAAGQGTELGAREPGVVRF